MSNEFRLEMLAAAGVAAQYCARPEVWDDFCSWMTDYGLLKQGEEVSREFLERVPGFIAYAVKEDLVESFAAQLKAL